MLIKRGKAEIVSIIEAPELFDEEAEKLTKAAKDKLKKDQITQPKDLNKVEN